MYGAEHMMRSVRRVAGRFTSPLDTGVVYKNVQLAEEFHRLFDQHGHIIRIGDIGVYADHLSTQMLVI